MTTPEARIRRPPLARTQPIRSFAALFNAAPPAQEKVESRTGPGGAVPRAVDLGYRVVDEYLRQGERAARRMADRSFGPAAFANDLQDLTARMFHYMSDFAGVWFELAGLSATGALARPGDAVPWMPRSAAPEPRVPETETARATAPTLVHERTRISVEVQSACPAEVTIDLRSGAAERALVVHELRALAAGKPRLADVAFVAASGERPARFRIRVPDAHPPGVYSGVIVDLATSVPAGTLCVRIPNAGESSE